MTNPEPFGGTVPRWTVGDRMRKARIYAGMTTDEMAADIGRTRRTISNYESSSTAAPLLVLRQYAMRTGVPLSWLEHGGDTPEGNIPNTGAHNLGYVRRLNFAAAGNVLVAA